MNGIKLTSTAEFNAEKAEELKAFSGLKLLHIKRQISLILAQIGRDGIFDEYTKHDITHVDYMLESLEWIIPKETQSMLTPADWLMITLSIYFHDLGMLVTKNEFKNRKNTTFPNFKQSILDGNYGLDYKSKIINISNQEEQDRFIYQELVRKTHAERIKHWILDESIPYFNIELEIVKEINKLLGNLDNMFRRDLALICESHHLSDLDDFNKYKPFQQYGPSKKEVVNLLYCALILRTADLLHITSDRTPAIEYSLINPTDPLSQEEWTKQNAVKTVRPQSKKNKEGQLDETIQKDTFEVIALFEEEKGFFGLISYLNYANSELKENQRINSLCNKQYSTGYEFPWKFIDDASIETKDFDRRQFEFILDQTKILDLLVGHTLYNDSTVVLRELTQNSIDASKLKKFELEQSGKANNYLPQIKISWNQNERVLSVMDNGTGMTLEIIQNHLLKVGASRYQDENFKKKYPNFSPISRFGIGLLTCFLIADDIDIITKSEEIEKAILLKIKKVHGKYLLKYINTEKLPNEIQNHGTIISLFVRVDVNLNNLENELRKWIIIPDCNLVLENNGQLTNIGHASPSEALKQYLREKGYELDDKSLKIKEINKEGITLAFALRYVKYWDEWEFLQYSTTDKFNFAPIGTCIEGIRVDFNTPGFNGKNLYAIVNTTGKNAPKTNVARSNIELTAEREALLCKVYQIYFEHIINELQDLRKDFSITWAANEANWMINKLVSGYKYRYNDQEVKIEDPFSLEKALTQIQCILIEQKGNRNLVCFNELKEIKNFWTIDCASYLSADSLIKEVKSSNTSALALLNTIYGSEDSNTAHIETLLCNQQSDIVLDRLIYEYFQVDSIKIIPGQRRLDLRWSQISQRFWEEIEILTDEGFGNSVEKCYVQLKDIEIDSSITQIAIYSTNALFILKNSELNTFLIRLIEKLPEKTQEDKIALSKVVSLINSLFYYHKVDKTKIEEYIEKRFERSNYRDIGRIVWERVDKKEFISIVLKTNFLKYDTTIWYRRDEY